jgi:hypothetical protein
MESMFIALKEDTKLELATDTEKRILLGAWFQISLSTETKTERINIVFPAETILLASQNFLKENYQSSSTLEHRKHEAI